MPTSTWTVQGNGNILNHELKLNASEYLPTDDGLIPLGDSEPVAGTPMDFVNAKAIGKDINEDFDALKYGKGYDSCWVIDGCADESVRFCRGTLFSGKRKGAPDVHDAAGSAGLHRKLAFRQPGREVRTRL